MQNKTLKREIQSLSKSILQQINDTKSPNELGISNGHEIINVFIENNEIGLAFKHLIYSIESVDLKLTAKQKEKIERIGIVLN